ncbi:ammonium transporter AmtB-like domain-containing protein [Catenaria anguillulae PL171]|uniref:Ammonium transporter AmtB-like domain-containing protein n=1 Tax=Catenaria anguillulae PL171 TaxID=765915 RepID=A0A1Y2HT37_9FUNG|nr:ammonium transporter AmtB-like domain-containing protein [Catenaria anguillulae PL171]
MLTLRFGWYGFNGGSAGAANARAALAMVTTTLAAALGGLTWLVIDYVRDRRVSALGFCSGVVSGLVAITPACGHVSPASSLAFGFLGGFVCNYASRLKHQLRFDDTLDAFGIHGVGGTLGGFLTGIFADKAFIALDGTEKLGGAMSGHPMQIVYQLASIGAGIGWSFFVTLAIAFIMDKCGLKLRASAEDEEYGMDHAQMGEFVHDYVADRVSNSIEMKRSGSRDIAAVPRISDQSQEPAKLIE